MYSNNHILTTKRPRRQHIRLGRLELDVAYMPKNITKVLRFNSSDLAISISITIVPLGIPDPVSILLARHLERCDRLAQDMAYIPEHISCQ
jgi:hypothetical protein